MVAESYTSRIVQCILAGRCSSSDNNLDISSKQNQDVMSSPLYVSQTKAPQASAPSAVNAQSSSPPCFSCRIVGTCVFTGVSLYSLCTGFQAPIRSADRRLGVTIGVVFGILGIYRGLRP